MFCKVLMLLLASLSFQHIDCITRVDIRSQFQPTLLRLRDLANTKFLKTEREYRTLVDQLNKYQIRSKNTTQTQINNIKNVLADAKKSKNVTTPVLNCLNAQQSIANGLTSTGLNKCFSSANNTDLKVSRQKFNTLAFVAVNTVNYCQYLNPLESQLEPYGKCLADKVPDLNRQINIVDREYEELSNATLHYNIKCLTDNTGAVLGQIGLISYSINVCFFTSLQ